MEICCREKIDVDGKGTLRRKAGNTDFMKVCVEDDQQFASEFDLQSHTTRRKRRDSPMGGQNIATVLEAYRAFVSEILL